MKEKNMNTKYSNSISRFLSRVTSVFLILLLTVFLFYTGNDGFVGIQNSKYHLFLLLCGGFTVLSFISLLEGTVLGIVKFPSIKNLYKNLSLLQKTTLIYLLFTWLSATASKYFPETIIGATRCEGALTITIYCMLFLLVSRYGTSKKYMLWLLATASVLFGTICIIQLSDINIFNLYPDGYKYSDAYVAYSGAYLGTIGNVDLVASFFCLIIPILGVALVKIKSKTKFVLLLPLAILLYVLIKMNVLAGLVGIAIGTLIIVPVVFLKTKKSRTIYALCAIMVGLVGSTFIYIVDFPFELFHQIHELMHGHLSDSFGSGRIHIWKSVLSDLPNHFWLGSGPDTMAYTELEPFKRYDPTLNSMLISGIDIAHSEYLNVLSQQGIFAFIAFMVLAIFTLFKWISAPFDNLNTKILGSALLCYFIQALFGFSMCMTAPFFWVTLGLFDKSLKGEEIICGRK